MKHLFAPALCATQSSHRLRFYDAVRLRVRVRVRVRVQVQAEAETEAVSARLQAMQRQPKRTRSKAILRCGQH